MQKSRGSMGTRKHGRKGKPGPSPQTKFMTALELNRLAAQRAQLKPKPQTFGSLTDLMRHTRRPS